MTEEEKEGLDKVYVYVKNLLNYDSNQALSRKMVLRLKGLRTNKFIENNNTQSTSNYSYETILNTFKFCSQDIRNGLRTNMFKDENHRFNYILKIVENNINDVYLREKNIERAKEEAKAKSVEIITHTGAEFKPREKKNRDRYKNLW